ncbi:MAG: hypothetical protein JWL71_4416 [Acidobacteria bacterium]|nr:hypothetical protein [Acidobacteriota bacterium]
MISTEVRAEEVGSALQIGVFTDPETARAWLTRSGVTVPVRRRLRRSRARSGDRLFHRGTPATERRAIVAILRDTRKNLPANFR